MNFNGGRLISRSEARALIAALPDTGFDKGILDDDLMLGGAGEAQVLHFPDGLSVAGDMALEWEEARHGGVPVTGYLVEGDLEVGGDILNGNWDGGPFLVATGESRFRHLFKRGAPVIFAGPVRAEGGILCTGNHGLFFALRGVSARALITLDHYTRLEGEMTGPAYAGLDRRDDLGEILIEELTEEDDDGEVYPVDDFDMELERRIRKGLPIFRQPA